jgi:hypothetical protein
MEFLSANDMLWKLRHVPDGTTLFVSYLAGRKPTERAIVEATRHTTNPTRPRRYYLGELSSVWQSQKGDWILTMKVFNRDTLQNDGSLEEGGYRSFNPDLGRLVLVDVFK